jgi:tryptophan synthase alpha chain
MSDEAKTPFDLGACSVHHSLLSNHHSSLDRCRRMSAIDDLFARLRSEGRKALMPFVTAGDPDLEFTAAVLREVVSRGAGLCELGIPYSDPIADGPVIQASYTRALEKKVKLAEILRMLGGVAPKLAAPVVTMVSYAIIYRHGLAKYVDEAKAAGAAGAIVPDLLVEESAEFVKVCRERDFSLIQLITPTTPRDRAVRIAANTTGFIYYVSVTGITGERTELPAKLLDDVAWLRGQTPLPICIGFGISKPEHVQRLAPVADGLIVGSAIVRRIAEAATRPREAVLRDVGGYVAELIAALR